jgi:hypothetical protein
LLRRNEEYSRIFERITPIITRERVPERAAVPLFDASLGLRLTNSRYRAEAEVSELVASRDLKRLSDAGLLIPIGEKRARYYRAAPELVAIRAASRLPKPVENPYEIVARRVRPPEEEPQRLPGL